MNIWIVSNFFFFCYCKQCCPKRAYISLGIWATVFVGYFIEETWIGKRIWWLCLIGLFTFNPFFYAIFI